MVWEIKIKMKKFLSIIKTLDESNSTYYNYNTYLAKDNKLKLDFVYSYDPARRNIPAPITGAGLAYPHSLTEKMKSDSEKDAMADLLRPYIEKYKHIGYFAGKGDIVDKLEVQAEKDNYIMCVMQKMSSDSWWNVVLGTDETYVAKNTDIPCLYIPFDYTYIRPRTGMVFVDSYSKDTFDRLREIAASYDMHFYFVVELKMDKEELKKIQNELSTCDHFDTAIIELKSEQFDDHIFDGLVKRFKVDWLGFAHYSKSMIERLYDKNENRFLLQSDMPTLIV